MYINIFDSAWHADFGGEVERILSMVDSVLLLVDAVEGPMPQTRFVTSKALALGLRPIVVINKVDRSSARPDWVVDQTFDLFDRLGASDAQLDFPVVYSSALEGWASFGVEDPREDMVALFQTIKDHVPPPDVDEIGPFQLQVSALTYSSYVGVIGIGRVQRGRVSQNSAVTLIDADGNIPSDPVSSAISSLIISPKRLLARIMSNVDGLLITCIAALSIYKCSSSTSLNSVSWSHFPSGSSGLRKETAPNSSTTL